MKLCSRDVSFWTYNTIRQAKRGLLRRLCTYPSVYKQSIRHHLLILSSVRSLHRRGTQLKNKKCFASPSRNSCSLVAEFSACVVPDSFFFVMCAAFAIASLSLCSRDPALSPGLSPDLARTISTQSLVDPQVPRESLIRMFLPCAFHRLLSALSAQWLILAGTNRPAHPFLQSLWRTPNFPS